VIYFGLVWFRLAWCLDFKLSFDMWTKL